MSGYFQRLAQRTGLVATPSSRANGTGQMVTPGGAPGLEQEQIVEVPQPNSAPAASHEHSRNQAKTPAGEGARAMPTGASNAQSAQTRASLREPQFMSTPGPDAAPAAGEAVMPPQEHAAPAAAVEEREELVRAARMTIAAPRGLDTEATGPGAAQRQHAPGPLEHSGERLAARTAADAHAGSVRHRALQPHAEDAASTREQPDSESIELEVRTLSRQQSATGLPGRPLPAQASMLRAATPIDVRIGTVAIEVHQAAPQVLAPPPSAVLAPAPRPAAPRERFSPSRHYLRMD